MNAKYPLLLGIALTVSALAQEPGEPKKGSAVSDVVQKAIDEFNRLKKEGKAKANEVTVVLEPPAPSATAIEEEVPETNAVPDPAESDEKPKPLLVTGKPPAIEEAATDPADDQEDALAEVAALVEDDLIELDSPTEQQEPGLEIRVESIRKGSGQIDPSLVKLKAGFPAKLLSTAPNGWILERSGQAPAFSKDVELQPGTTISLSIQPHVLTPDSDGIDTFSVGEPGFHAAQGYLQKDTVSAILGNSVAQLDQDAVKLGNAISGLHQLLSSLPKPEEPEKSEKP
jgi:hypothetical protein